jgi:hypothetical protein
MFFVFMQGYTEPVHWKISPPGKRGWGRKKSENFKEKGRRKKRRGKNKAKKGA